MNKNEVLYPTAGPPHVLNWPDVVPKCYVTFVYQKKKKVPMEWIFKNGILASTHLVWSSVFWDLNWLQGKGCLMGGTFYLDNINCFWNKKHLNVLHVLKPRQLKWIRPCVTWRFCQTSTQDHSQLAFFIFWKNSFTLSQSLGKGWQY